MLASLPTGYSSFIGNEESPTRAKFSGGSRSTDADSSQRRNSLESNSSPELPVGRNSFVSCTRWSFNGRSSCLIREEEKDTLFISNKMSYKLSSPEKIDQSSCSTLAKEKLTRSRSAVEPRNGDIMQFRRPRSGEFKLTDVSSVARREGITRTLDKEWVSGSSLLPRDKRRSLSSTSGTAESTEFRPAVASLVKKRIKIEENLNSLQVQLLESLREEWILTGVIPDGYEEIQSQVIASNPRLKMTSFPLSHLLPRNQTESQVQPGTVEKKKRSNSTSVCNETGTDTVASPRDSLVSYDYANYCLTDSLDSSVSSVLEDLSQSIHWSQCDNASITKFDSFSELKPDEAREKINKKLLALEQDFTILTQLYRVHKQQAEETNRAAFRKAYKCNARKLKELGREKAVLREQLQRLDVKILRSNSLLTDESSQKIRKGNGPTLIDVPTVTTLPRRKTLQFPSLSAAATIRFAGWKKRLTLKNPEPESSTKKFGRQENRIENCGAATTTAHFARPRNTIFPLTFRLPKRQGATKSKIGSQMCEDSGAEKKHIDQVCQALLRPHSSLESESPCHENEFSPQLSERRIRKSISSPVLHDDEIDKHPRERMLDYSERNDECKISELNETSATPECCTSSHDIFTGNSNCLPTTTIRSSSGYHSVTSQTSQRTAEVCLRQPADTPIRCICSCVLERSFNKGTCGYCDELQGKKEATRVEEMSTTPVPSKREHLEMETRKPTRRSMNPLAFFLPQVDSRRKRIPLFQQRKHAVIQPSK